MNIKGNKRVHEYYHKATSSQRKIISKNNFTYRILLEVINKFLYSPKKILDIGCGAGTISLYLSSKGNGVVGIDISETAIKACVDSLKLTGLKNASFKVLDFPYQVPNEHFDFIICSEVIEHLKDDTLALKRIYELLKKGGIGVISTPSKNAPLYRLGLTKKFDKQVGHLRRYDLNQLIAICKNSGFTILETKKTEGVIRNFLFLNPIAGRLIRFIKFFFSDLVTFIDEISLKVFGESQIFVIVKRE